MDAFARFAQPWLDRAARIGADPRDDDEVRLLKALLVLVSVLILPISLAWGAIYLALGARTGLIAWLYFGVSVGATKRMPLRERPTPRPASRSCRRSSHRRLL